MPSTRITFLDYDRYLVGYNNVSIEPSEFTDLLQIWLEQSLNVVMDVALVGPKVELDNLTGPFEFLQTVPVAGRLHIDLSVCKDEDIRKKIMALFASHNPKYL